MNMIIIILMVLTFYHFVYEGIIVPSIRLHLRNQLFVLRDEIRAIKIEGLDKHDEDAFWLVHNEINSFLNRISKLTIARRHLLEKEYDNNTDLQEKVQKGISTITSCNNENIKNIFMRTHVVIEYAFIINMGGWFVYLLPVVVVILSISKISQLARELIATPSYETDRLIPAS